MISKEKYLQLKAKRKHLASNLAALKRVIKVCNSKVNSNGGSVLYKKYKDSQSQFQLSANQMKIEYNLTNELIQTTKELLKAKRYITLLSKAF